MPDGLTGVGWGIVVGAQESWARQDEDGWRRPLAFGKMGPKVPSERASCSRAVGRGYVGEMGSNMDERLWRPLKWKQRLHALHGEGPQVLRRMR